MRVYVTGLADLQGHRDEILDVRLSPDGLWMASSSVDGAVCVWNVGRQSLVQTLQGDQPSYIEISPNGQTLATAEASAPVRLWRPDGTLSAELHSSQRQPSIVAFSPDGRYVIAGYRAANAAVWSHSGALIAELDHEGQGVGALCLSSDGRWLLTGDSSGRLHLWEVGSWRRIQRFSAINAGAQAAPIIHVQFAADSQTVVTRSRTDAGDVQVWRLLNTGGTITVSLVSTLIPQPDRLVSNPRVANRLPLLSLSLTGIPRSTDTNGAPRSEVSAGADAAGLSSHSHAEDEGFDYTSAALVYDLRSLHLAHVLTIPNDMAVRQLFTGNDRFLVTVGAAGEGWVWDTHTWQHVGGFSAYAHTWDWRDGAPSYAVGGLDSTPDGRLLVTAGLEPREPTGERPYGGPVDHVIKLWRVAVDDSE